MACLAEAGEESVFKKLLSKVKDAQTLDAQTLVSLLKLFQDVNPKLRATLLEWEGGTGEAPQQTGREVGAASGKAGGQPYRQSRSPETPYPYSDAGGLSHAGQDPGAFPSRSSGVQAVRGSPHCCLEGWIDGCAASVGQSTAEPQD